MVSVQTLLSNVESCNNFLALQPPNTHDFHRAQQSLAVSFHLQLTNIRTLSADDGAMLTAAVASSMFDDANKHRLRAAVAAKVGGNLCEQAMHLQSRTQALECPLAYHKCFARPPPPLPSRQ